MSTAWLKESFGVDKPIIAMCHLQAMPSDPGYDAEKGMDYVVEMARHDMLALQQGGVDAIMFSNEFSLPYRTSCKPVTAACMARIIGELKHELTVPFGVNVLWDPFASIDLAAATDALFIREIMSGVYASDFGLWNTDPGKVARHKLEVNRPDLKLLYNIVPEAAKYLANRDIVEIAKTTVFNNKPDALCVSGLTAGVETDTQILCRVKEVVPDTVVFCNTGCRIHNIERQLSYADGAVVGTTFKVDGKFENAVDEKNVKAFMDVVKAFRKK
ncbi:MAG: BtpA/SgcQ family protein [Oscillospiraceae bacterium]|nr:BtpA/SgcQ family protein [Oscillospiraceae bacterium]